MESEALLVTTGAQAAVHPPPPGRPSSEAYVDRPNDGADGQTTACLGKR
jgi:hypothetical protein